MRAFAQGAQVGRAHAGGIGGEATAGMRYGGQLGRRVGVLSSGDDTPKHSINAEWLCFVRAPD